ncbi:MAG TPA: ROK family glucokinase [Frankiaceae bacterium]|nr:ROK family glucokinase [Frankiaceae bacterium]
MGLAIGIDVGGTKILAGVVDDDGHLSATTGRPTPSTDPEAVADAIAEIVDELRGKVGSGVGSGADTGDGDGADTGAGIETVGIGAAGFVDRDRSTLLFAPNLAWRDEPLRDKVAKRVELPVVVENDANATAWGEFRFGAGRERSDLICLTIGTGIGGGIVLGEALYRGSFGIGGEVGHIRVVPNGRRCGCGNRGCWEQYCSGRALVREAQEIARVDPRYGGRLRELGGGEPSGIDGQHVTTAAEEGDPAALECYGVIGRWLGQGLADLAAVLDPSTFVIGGGVSEAGDLLLEPARAAFGQRLTGHGHRSVADVLVAELGAQAGLIGAADLSRQPDSPPTQL